MEEEADILRTAGKQIFPMTISRNPAMKPINMMKEKFLRALSKCPAPILREMIAHLFRQGER